MCLRPLLVEVVHRLRTTSDSSVNCQISTSALTWGWEVWLYIYAINHSIFADPKTQCTFFWRVNTLVGLLIYCKQRWKKYNVVSALKYSSTSFSVRKDVTANFSERKHVSVHKLQASSSTSPWWQTKIKRNIARTHSVSKSKFDLKCNASWQTDNDVTL